MANPDLSSPVSINGFMNSPSRSPTILPNIGALPSPGITIEPLSSPQLSPPIVSQPDLSLPLLKSTTLNSNEVIGPQGKSVTTNSLNKFSSQVSLPTTESFLRPVQSSPVLKPLSQLSADVPLSQQLLSPTGGLVPLPSVNMSPTLKPTVIESRPTTVIPSVQSSMAIRPRLGESQRLVSRPSTQSVSRTSIRPATQPLMIRPRSTVSQPISVTSNTVITQPSVTLQPISTVTSQPTTIQTIIKPSVTQTGITSTPVTPQPIISQPSIVQPSITLQPTSSGVPTDVSVLQPQTAVMPSITTSSEEAASKMEFSTPSGIVEDQDILKLLVNKGFQPMNSIMVQTTEGNMAKYIKTLDSKGNRAYVVIDKEGNVMKKPGDLTTIESNKATSIPLSAKIDAYNCAGLDICAVALECNDGVCMLMRDDDAKMKEIMLTKVKNKTNGAIVESDSPIGYPVVRLSEILQNPVLVSQIIDSNTRKIRAATTSNYVKRLETMVEGRDKSINNVNVFVKAMDEAFVNVLTELKALEKKRKQFDVMPPKNPPEKKELNQTVYKIRNRSDMLYNIFKISKNIDRYTQIFNEISEDARSLNIFINETYSNL